MYVEHNRKSELKYFQVSYLRVLKSSIIYYICFTHVDAMDIGTITQYRTNSDKLYIYLFISTWSLVINYHISLGWVLQGLPLETTV